MTTAASSFESTISFPVEQEISRIEQAVSATLRHAKSLCPNVALSVTVRSLAGAEVDPLLHSKAASAGEHPQNALERERSKRLGQLSSGHWPKDGWESAKNLSAIIKRLRPNQRQVILKAMDNAGCVTREEAYDIIGRDESQSLNGFTKPVKAVVDKMLAAGELKLGADARPLLKAFYGDGETKSQGFVVPLSVVSAMLKERGAQGKA